MIPRNKAYAYYKGPGLTIAADLNEILASRVKTKFAHRINFDEIGYDNHNEMKAWCKKNA